MRDIKFRVRNLKHNHFEDLSDIIITFDSVGFEIYNYEGSVLDGYELNQYTGLKDKNGKEIYEGDILLYNNHIKVIVWYKNGAFVRSYKNSNVYLMYDSFITDGCLDDYEVIGNIYENKDLLEGFNIY